MKIFLSTITLWLLVSVPALAVNTLILSDDFDGNSLDPLWQVTFESGDGNFGTNGWVHTVGSSTLSVEDITGTAIDSNDWGIVKLSQAVPPLGDFRVEMEISWNSDGPAGQHPIEAMFWLFAKVLDGNGATIARGGYLDTWQDDYGTRRMNRCCNVPSSLSVNGNARFAIERVADSVTFTWNQDPINGNFTHTQSVSVQDAEKIQITFAFFDLPPYRPVGRSHFGTLSVHKITVEGTPLNNKPTAEAGVNQSIHAGQMVNLDGTGSSDDTTASEDLLYAWSFITKPVGSIAVLANSDTATPSFEADLPGDYVIELIVTDEGGLSSDSDEVMVSSLNTPPNANAGPNQGTYVGDFVTLDGSGSNDPDGDSLTYSWLLTEKPVGSLTVLNGESSVDPTLEPDLPGNYNVDLTVNDGFADSASDQMVVSVASPEDYAGVKTMEAINAVGALPQTSVTTPGNQNALGNYLTQVIEALTGDDISKAIDKLEKAIERTDGCALRNDVDLSGGGQIKQDHINNCPDQETVYPLLRDAINALLDP